MGLNLVSVRNMSRVFSCSCSSNNTVVVIVVVVVSAFSGRGVYIGYNLKYFLFLLLYNVSYRSRIIFRFFIQLF